MFNFFKKNTGKIIAPISGKIIAISDCEDAVFSEKILGDGVAVIPDGKSGTIVSPVNGKVVNTVNTLHAFGLETDDGVELLVHIGLNTVELKGEGFENLVQLGDTVKAGEPLCKVDFNLISAKGYPLQTPVVITDMSGIGKLEIHTGAAVAGETCIMEYTKK